MQARLMQIRMQMSLHKELVTVTYEAQLRVGLGEHMHTLYTYSA